MQGRTETSDERGVAQKVPLLAKNALQERGRVEGVEATAQCDTIQDYPEKNVVSQIGLCTTSAVRCNNEVGHSSTEV